MITDSKFKLGNKENNIFKARGENIIKIKNALISGKIDKNKNVILIN